MKADISPLRAITPPNAQYDIEQFMYPGLKQYVDSNCIEEYKKIDDSLKQDGDLFWSRLERRRIAAYLPVISLKLQESTSRDEQEFWSRQLTHSSSSLFGKPDADEARLLVAGSLDELKSTADRHRVNSRLTDLLFDTYNLIAKPGENTSKDNSADYTELLPRIKQILYMRYKPVYDILDGQFKDDEIMQATTIRSYFKTMLDELAAHDLRWRGWRVCASDSTQMSVVPVSQVINVGKFMPAQTAKRVKSLFTHEVIVHAGRSVQGLEYGHNMAYGLPGYTESEEGLGILMEAAIEGQMPHRAADRYIDIALALGLLDLPPMSRLQLYELVLGRSILQRLGEGIPVDMDEMQRATWQHVNRFYRGSLGNDVIGVMTKDVVYYQGFKRMAYYLGKYKNADLHRAVKFVLSGKMNPDSSEHRSYIHDLKFNVSR